MKYEPTLSLLQRGTVIVPPRETIAPRSEKQRGTVVAPRREIIAPLSPLQLKTMNTRTVAGGRAATVGSLGGGDLNGTAATLFLGQSGTAIGGGPVPSPSPPTPPVTTSVWSANDAAANGMTLTNGGLTVTPSGAASYQSIRSSIGKTSGLLYAEFSAGTVAASQNQVEFGVASSGFNPVGYLGQTNYSAGSFAYSGFNDVSSGFTSNYTPATLVPATNDVWGLAINFTTGNIWLAINGIWVNGSNPATGSSPVFSFVPATVGALFLGMTFNGPNNGVWTLQPTAASQTYAPPSGFSAWG